VRRSVLASFLASVLFALSASAAPALAQAQQQASSSQMTHTMHMAHMSQAELETFAKAAAAIGAARDSMQAQVSAPKNAKVSAQQDIRAKFDAQVGQILRTAGMTQQEFDQKTFVVSADTATRRAYDALIAKITGQPIPVYVAPNAAPQVKVPATAAGMHIGHVVNSFSDTPGAQGLLPLAVADARVAAQHAQLAARNPTNLESIKLHAGHVLNALDPSVVPMGPGSGYGVRRAATGVATHIELAAKAADATPNIVTHAAHVAMAARNTTTRADQAIELAKKIRESASAEDAMKLLNELIPLTQQLMAGMDANADGKVTPDEGGLQLAEDHMRMMLAAEKLP
jgi:hypothetical protein